MPRRFCCPRHGGRPDQWDDLVTDGEFYAFPLSSGWTGVLVRRGPDSFESQEFPTEQQALAWAEGNPQVPLF